MKLRKCLLEGGFGAFFDEIVPLVLTPQFIKENRDALAEVKVDKIKTELRDTLISSIDAGLKFKLKNKIPEISKPLLLISGKEDVFTPFELAEQIQSSTKNSSHEFIENTGHNVLLPPNISLITEIILNFFRML